MYVGLIDERYFTPGELGIGLVDGYDSMGFEMSKPYLRAELESDLKKFVLVMVRRYSDSFLNSF
jgi:DNA topoisomerase-3